MPETLTEVGSWTVVPSRGVVMATEPSEWSTLTVRVEEVRVAPPALVMTAGSS